MSLYIIMKNTNSNFFKLFIKPLTPFIDSIPDSGLSLIHSITSNSLSKFETTKFKIFDRVHQQVSLAIGIRLPITVSKTNVRFGDFKKYRYP